MPLITLLRELTTAKGDGQYSKLLTRLAKVDVLILDDWRLMKLSAENRRDLLEDRHNRRSTIATSQLPIEKWHGVIVDATLADSILDRLVHNAHRSISEADPCENGRQS